LRHILIENILKDKHHTKNIHSNFNWEEVAMKKLFYVFVIAVFLVPLSGMAADLTTDSTLYPPGDIVLISGSGYGPNEVVTLQVAHLNGAPLEGDAGQPWDVTADEYGSITSSWITPFNEQPVDTLNLSGLGDPSGEEGDAVFLVAIKSYYDQLQNGASPSWSGGVINSSNSCYSESRSVPYRYLIKGLMASTQHYITIRCGWTKAGIHGFDYFTDYDLSEASGILAAGGTCGGTPPPSDCLPISGTFPFPDPTNTANYSGAIPSDFFPTGFALDGPRNLSMYNATVDSVSKYWFSGTPSDRIYNIIIYFTVNSTGSVGFYWGGHMAEGAASTWGIGNGSGSITGAPIHMEAGILDGSGGTSVLPVQGGTICLPPDATITCNSDTVCTNSSYACTVPTPTSGTATYIWTLDGGTINSGQGTYLIDYTVTATYPGSVTIMVEACDTSSGCPGDYCCASDTIELPLGYCCDPPVATCPNDTTIFACDLSQICLPGFDCNGTATVIGGTLNGNQVCFTPAVGLNVITLICANSCGDADTCVTNVTVTLNSPPVCSLPPNDTFFVCYDTTFNFSVSATDPDNNLVGCTKTSGDGSFDGSTWTFTTSGSGTYSGTFECEDNCGATCGGTVNIVFSMDDNEPPVAICPSDITVNNDQGQCGAVVSFAIDATDNCPGVTVAANPASGSFFGLGTTAVEVIATDASGNKDTCYFNVTVNDTEDPVANCPSNITTGNDQGQCGALVSFTATAADNCPGASVITNPVSGSFFGLGTTQVEVIATDAAGNKDTCYFNVTVNDTEDPVAVCPSDITVNNDAGQCGAVVSFAIDATDNCPGATVIANPASGSFFGIGTTPVEVIATDASGNKDTCYFSVTVNDTENPVADCPSDITTGNDQGQCGATVSFSVSATDNCPGVTVTANPSSGSFFGLGTTAVEVIATDASGNKDTCYFDITVNDNEDPVANCPADITTGNDQGQCGAAVAFSIDAADNCPGVTVAANPASGSFFGLGTTAVEVIATDAVGNKDTCYFNVTVNEIEDPVAICPSDITVDNDPGACGAVVSFSIDATDNCPGVTVAANPASGNFFDVGTNVVEVIATDASGNKDTCYFDVIVNDNEDPDITCPADFTVECNGPTDPASTGYATATDNCDPDPTITYADVQNANVITRTWTATDMYNNSSQCDQTITIEPNTPPVCNVPNDTLIFLCTASEVCLPVSATDAEDNLVGCEVVNGIGYIDNGNWCYTPSGNESQTVVIKCTDICGEYCQESFQVEFEIYAEWAIIAVDRTGSMYLENPLGQSRLERAKASAHIDIDKLLDPGDADYPGIYRVAVMYFNSSDGIVLQQMFTSDAVTLHNAIDAIPGPKHDTPLAAAMCQAHCLFPGMQDCSQYLFVYTDGLENASHYFDMCDVCDPCNQHIPSGWNFDCDPTNPSTCTDWQICLYNIFAASGINMIHYFGEPINPFVKGGEVLEDLYFLKATAEGSQGIFRYYSDQDAPGYFCGDANRDFTVNVSDAVYIINYVFAGGDPPDPYMAGDTNCDGAVNVSDAVWIINYVFVGGNAPCDNDNDGVPDC
jgi:hypothetical protein